MSTIDFQVTNTLKLFSYNSWSSSDILLKSVIFPYRVRPLPIRCEKLRNLQNLHLHLGINFSGGIYFHTYTLNLTCSTSFFLFAPFADHSSSPFLGTFLPCSPFLPLENTLFEEQGSQHRAREGQFRDGPLHKVREGKSFLKSAWKGQTKWDKQSQIRSFFLQISLIFADFRFS